MEELLRSQKSRHQEVKQGPELENIVLHGSSRKNKPVICDHTFYSAGDFCFCVLDNVSLIECTVVETVFADEIYIVPADIIGSNYNIMLRDLASHTLSFRWRTNIHKCFQKGSVIGNFLLPMASDSWRTDNERWERFIFEILGDFESFRPKIVIAGNDAYRLKCLPETHI
jgi:hypothetical protein